MAGTCAQYGLRLLPLKALLVALVMLMPVAVAVALLLLLLAKPMKRAASSWASIWA